MNPTAWKGLPRLHAACLLLPMLLAACGGGGGGGGGNAAGLVFEPARVEQALFQGDAGKAFTVKAFPQRNFEGYVVVVIEDQVGVIQPGASIVENGDGSYSATLRLRDDLAAGTHQGEFIVKLCRSESCSLQHPGSPMRLPYIITVAPHTNLTALVKLPGAPAWPTYQGNAAHTGFVPVTLDASRFTPRWIWRAPKLASDYYQSISPVVVVNGQVHVSASQGFQSSTLYALRESDGGVQWQQGFGSPFALNPPAVSSDTVYVATSGHEATAMWRLSAQDGSVLSQTPFAAQWEHYYAPTVYGESVYANGGYYGGAYAFDKSTGAQQWFTDLNFYDGWTPAADEQNLYVYLGETCSGCINAGLFVLDRVTGALKSYIRDNEFQWAGWTIQGAPIIGSEGNVISVNQSTHPGYRNRLIRFDIAGAAIDWSTGGSFLAQPALADGIVYVGDNSSLKLRALRESDGSVVWEWPLPAEEQGRFRNNVVVTGNLVFIGTEYKTYAVDIATRKQVWSYPYGGALAISDNGILYLAETDGGRAVRAINLR